MSDEYKKDGGKPWISLLPRGLLEGVARVLEFGAKKYSRGGWIKMAHQAPDKVLYSRTLDAIGRHYAAVIGGELIDPESGLPHMAHMACDLGFILEYQRLGIGTDDLYRTPEKMPAPDVHQGGPGCPDCLVPDYRACVCNRKEAQQHGHGI